MSMFRTIQWCMLMLMGSLLFAGCQHEPVEQKKSILPSISAPKVVNKTPDCNEVRDDVKKTSQNIPAEELDRILAYQALINRLTPKQVNQEYKITKERFAKNPNENLDRFRLILLLINAKGELKNYKTALNLLNEYLDIKYDKNRSLLSFAELLALIIKEQIAIAEHDSSLEKKVQIIEKNAKILQQQLDALKSIETSIHRRDIVEGQ